MKKVISIRKYIQDYKSNILSQYCLNKCIDTCCNFTNKWPLELVNEDEVDGLFSLDQRINFELSKKLTENDNGNGRYYFTGGICPQYEIKSHNCKIHNKERPLACEQFPIVYTNRKGLYLNAACEYIEQNWEQITKEFIDQNFIELQRENAISLLIPNKNIIKSYNAITQCEKIKRILNQN